MALFGQLRTGIETTVTFPNLQANPAKLVITNASHVHTATVFVDGGLAHRALLSNDLIHPEILLSFKNVCPDFEVSTGQRRVVPLLAESADFGRTTALNNRLNRIVHENGFAAILANAEYSPRAFLSVPETQQFIEMGSVFSKLPPNLLHKQIVGFVVAAFPLAVGKELILVAVGMMEQHV